MSALFKSLVTPELCSARIFAGMFIFLVCTFMLIDTATSSAGDARYAQIKDLARKEFESDRLIGGLMVDQTGIDLIDCGAFSVKNQPGGSKMRSTDRLRFDLAMSAVKLEAAIQDAGYNISGFKGVIEAFERNSLEKGYITAESARRKGYDSVSYPYAALNRESERQRQTKPKLPKFYVFGGCGDGEVPVYFEHHPKLITAKLIRAGLLELCALDMKQGTDALVRSLSDCNWEPIAFGKANYLSGRYVIWSYWEDGSCSASTQDIGYFDLKKLAPDQLRYPLQKTDRTCRL